MEEHKGFLLAVVAIVAIVGIVGLIVMITGYNLPSETQAGQALELAKADIKTTSEALLLTGDSLSTADSELASQFYQLSRDAEKLSAFDTLAIDATLNTLDEIEQKVTQKYGKDTKLFAQKEKTKKALDVLKSNIEKKARSGRVPRGLYNALNAVSKNLDDFGKQVSALIASAETMPRDISALPINLPCECPENTLRPDGYELPGGGYVGRCFYQICNAPCELRGEGINNKRWGTRLSVNVGGLGKTGIPCTPAGMNSGCWEGSVVGVGCSIKNGVPTLSTICLTEFAGQPVGWPTGLNNPPGSCAGGQGRCCTSEDQNNGLCESGQCYNPTTGEIISDSSYT